MFIAAGEFDKAYKRIKEDALKGDCTVMIFVAPNTDSLCACWILTSLLKSDFIRYKMLPVADLTDLQTAKDVLASSPGDFKSVMMLNCGGMIDIVTEFEAEEEGSPLKDITFYIIDSHRPIDLSNAYDADRVVVFDDGQTQASIPLPEDVWNLSDSEDDDEGIDGNDDDGGRSKRRRTDGQRQDGALSPRSKREAREERDRQRLQYYSATSFGAAASVVVWQLAGDVGKTDNHLLWLGIIGLTDQFIQERIDSGMYMEGVERLAADVRRMNVVEGEGGGEVVDRMHIRQEEELRFMLLRHWTVLDAMSHSRYVATRLGIWKQSGRQHLMNLLAKMGMSIEQCKQQYSSMDMSLRKELFDQVTHYAHHYNLENCVYPSFVLQSGFRQQYSASDLVYAITGLLEATTENPLDPIDWKSNFYQAFDALGLKHRELLRKGTDNSMKQHAALLRQVESIVEGQNNIRKVSSFRYVFIKDHPDQKYFIHHPTLRRLGLFLMDTFRFSQDNRMRKRSLPLVLAALNPATETYIVAGIWSTLNRSEGSVPRNEFGPFFQQAGERADARVRMAAFDTSILEIKSDDMQKFIGRLSELTRM
eukprot:m.453060 g.453060  ORF g.453060 m.453060 type:complete len:591 (+) comp21546_c0_seq1:237-2009(+)